MRLSEASDRTPLKREHMLVCDVYHIAIYCVACLISYAARKDEGGKGVRSAHGQRLTP